MKNSKFYQIYMHEEKQRSELKIVDFQTNCFSNETADEKFMEFSSPKLGKSEALVTPTRSLLSHKFTSTIYTIMNLQKK